MKELLQATDDYSSFSVPIAKDTLLLIDQVEMILYVDVAILSCVFS